MKPRWKQVKSEFDLCPLYVIFLKFTCYQSKTPCFLLSWCADIFVWLGHSTKTCATCGGDSVCFVDCGTGRVMKKYKQPGETFYCLAWTTVSMDFGNGNRKKSNLLAAGGMRRDIKIIEPSQLVCLEEIRGHKGVLESLLFHPQHPTWLLSAADDNTVMVWEVGLPKGTEYEAKSK